MAKKGLVRIVVPLLISFVILALAGGCSKGRGPIKLGFLGVLSGPAGALGEAGRDGATLAVELQNQKGGINGRKLELLVKDSKLDALATRTAAEELVSQGAVGIVGPMTSSMASVGAEVANERKVMVIGPTTSTNTLSGKDDFFFRVYPSGGRTAEHMAEYVVNNLGLKKVGVVYDVANHDHTVGMYKYFRKRLEALGGKIVALETFHSKQSPDFDEIGKKLASSGGELFFINANARDTVGLYRAVKGAGSTAPAITSEWASTKDILTNSPELLKGLKFLKTFDATDESPAFKEFMSSFTKRYGYAPGFAAAKGYEAARVLIEATINKREGEHLKGTISRLGSFSGVQGELKFDEYGDVSRRYFMVEVVVGQFRRVDD